LNRIDSRSKAPSLSGSPCWLCTVLFNFEITASRAGCCSSPPHFVSLKLKLKVPLLKVSCCAAAAEAARRNRTAMTGADAIAQCEDWRWLRYGVPRVDVDNEWRWLWKEPGLEDPRETAQRFLHPCHATPQRCVARHLLHCTEYMACQYTWHASIHGHAKIQFK